MAGSNMMLILLIASFVTMGDCFAYIEKDNKKSKTQLKTLDHLLGDAQQKIRDSQDLIKCFESKNLHKLSSIPYQKRSDSYLQGKYWTTRQIDEGTTDLTETLEMRSYGPVTVTLQVIGGQMGGGQMVTEEPCTDPTEESMNKLMLHTTASIQEKPKYLWLTDPPSKPPLSPGDVLFGRLTLPTTKDPFEVALTNEMRFEKTGYLSVGFRSLCEQIALKQPIEAKALLEHTNLIVTKMLENKRLQWLGNPMTEIFKMVATSVSALPIDELKDYVVMLQYTMKHRRESISTYVNSIIDFADGMVRQDQGEHLFSIIKEFKNYPKGTKSGLEICEAMIQAFEAPYRAKLDTPDLQLLVDSANKAIKDRYPQILDLKLSLMKKLPKKPPLLSEKLKIRNISYFYTTSHGRHDPKNRRRGSGISIEFIPTRRQIPVNQFYNKNSNEETITRRYTKRTRTRTTSRRKIKTVESNIKKLSRENMNYYRDVKDDIGVKSDSNNYKDLSHEDASKKVIKKNIKYRSSEEFSDKRNLRTTKGRVRQTTKDDFMTEYQYNSDDTFD